MNTRVQRQRRSLLHHGAGTGLGIKVKLGIHHCSLVVPAEESLFDDWLPVVFWRAGFVWLEMDATAASHVNTWLESFRNDLRHEPEQLARCPTDSALRRLLNSRDERAIAELTQIVVTYSPPR